MREKRTSIVALAASAMLCVVAFLGTVEAASVTSSDQKITNGTIKGAIAKSGNNTLSNFDSKADERMRRVVKILRSSNKAQVNQFVPVAFELKNVNPIAVVSFIDRVIAVEEGNWSSFVSPEGDSGLLLVNVPLWQVEPLKELVGLLDRPGLTSYEGTVRKYIQLKHRDPASESFQDTIAGLQTASGILVADRATGAIYLEDAPSGIDAVFAWLDKIDLPTATVMLHNKIYELDLTNDGTLGLDFHAWKNGPGRNLFSAGAYREYYNVASPNNPLMLDPGVPIQTYDKDRLINYGFNGTYFYEVPSAYFDFLASKGRATVATSPRVVVRDGESAVFQSGEQILYYKVQHAEDALRPGDAVVPAPRAGIRQPGVYIDPFGEDFTYPDNRTVTGDATARVNNVTGSTPYRTYDLGNTGVFLEVTPSVAVNSIGLDINASVVSHLGYDGAGAPLLSTRNVNTNTRVAAGEEQILGGMTRTRSIQTTRKVPILGSIPVIGYLFGGEITTAKKTQLAMMVQADLVDDFSGIGPTESDVIDQVETPGMGHIEMPEGSAGFDQFLLD